MADISDVLVVLANSVSLALYPNGAGQPSVTGSDIIIYPGWPGSDNLDEDLLAGKTHVSVFPKAEERNTTRYPEKYQTISAPVATLTLTIQPASGGNLNLEGGGNLLLEDGSSLLLEGNSLQVVVGGTVSAPQNVMLRVNGSDYVYGVLASDTLASVAIALAHLVGIDFAGTYARGTTITFAAGVRVQAARVGGFGTVSREIRRQERVVMITVWAGDPVLRDKVAAAVDVQLAAQRFLTMPDGFGARLIYKNSLLVDSLQKAALYRRDLNYSIEFATTATEQAAAVIAPKLFLKRMLQPSGGYLELEAGGDVLLEDGTNLLLEDISNPTSITI